MGGEVWKEVQRIGTTEGHNVKEELKGITLQRRMGMRLLREWEEAEKENGK